MSLLIELHYLPCIAYFQQLRKYKKVHIEASENFQKQSYRNRCYILGANKVMNLTVPVHHRGDKIAVRDVQIDYSSNWAGIHWRSLVSAYGKSPYFAYYSEYFKEVIFKKHKFLFDLNLEMLHVCLRLLQADVTVELTQKYNTGSESGVKEWKDLRNQIHPRENDQLCFYNPVQYFQMFGKEFVPNLSIVDLLFCDGGQSL